MVYLYKCPHCKLETEITKPMAEVDRIEHCTCGSVMKRVYSGASIKTNDGFKK